MTTPIIICDGLSKQYNLGIARGKGLISGTPPSLREAISLQARGALASLTGRRREPEKGPRTNTLWALKDVSFEVRQGEVIGIVGRNGSGKSTLLKILSRIVEPTTGTARLRGRIASLLEVGTGFHPELSGRENIYLNGAILGMKKSEIDRKFDQIVDFSEIEQFLDTPVKRYSSGMYVRLAFAVAAHLEPEILIVDEVLAVGDFAFQKKCLGKMHDVAASDGRTVLFVSHQMGPVSQLCDRGILLEKGSIMAIGPIGDVIKSYLRSGLVPGRAQVSFPIDPTKESQFLSAEILHADGSPGTEFDCDDSFIIRLRFESRREDAGGHMWVTIQNLEGVQIIYSDIRDGEPGLGDDMHVGIHTYDIRIPQRLLAPTTYVVGIYYHLDYVGTVEAHPSCCEFTLHDLTHTRKLQPAILGIQIPWKHQYQENTVGVTADL
jgi:lipopolysaccharide transport system ATP-binding protein